MGEVRVLSSTLSAIAAIAVLSVTLTGCSDGDPEPTTTVTKTVTASPNRTPSSQTESTAATPAPTCGPTDVTDAAGRAIADLPLPAGLEGAEWDTAGADISGYEPCAALSWLTISVKLASGSSPVAILLFHDGTYLGTATKEQYAFVPDITRTQDDEIAVTYHYAKPGEATAGATGRTNATFTWNDSAGRVEMTGDVPPEG